MTSAFFLRWLQILVGVCAPLPEPSLVWEEQYVAPITQGYEYHEVAGRKYHVNGMEYDLVVDTATYMSTNGTLGKDLGTMYLVNGVPTRSAPSLSAAPLRTPPYCSLPLRTAPHW